MIIIIDKRIAELRKKYGYTQKKLAEKLSVTRGAINNWEMGTGMPSIYNLIALADIFKVSIDYLIGLDTEMKINVSNLSERDLEFLLPFIKFLEERTSTRAYQ